MAPNRGNQRDERGAARVHAWVERLWASVPDRWLTGRPAVFDIRPKEAGLGLVLAFVDARLGRVYAEPGTPAFELIGESLWYCSAADAAAAGYAGFAWVGLR